MPLKNTRTGPKISPSTCAAPGNAMAAMPVNSSLHRRAKAMPAQRRFRPARTKTYSAEKPMLYSSSPTCITRALLCIFWERVFTWFWVLRRKRCRRSKRIHWSCARQERSRSFRLRGGCGGVGAADCSFVLSSIKRFFSFHAAPEQTNDPAPPMRRYPRNAPPP